jgi:hypothetical protein
LTPFVNPVIVHVNTSALAVEQVWPPGEAVTV